MAIFSKKENTGTEETQAKASKPQTAGAHKPFATVIVQPRISEKSSHLSNAGKYVFNVLRDANKIEIKRSVEKAYHVTVTAVNIVNVKGKKRNFGRIAGRTSAFKKAVVTLKKGDKIEGATENI